jgi:2-haloacid dehalogenase
MPRYDYVLFDADNTLFDFDQAERLALRLVLEKWNYPTDLATQQLYLSINEVLWNRLNRGEISQKALVVERFSVFCRVMGRQDDPEALNRDYLTLLGEQSILLPGAESLCRALASHCTLAIITNGMSIAQRGRFNRSPLRDVIPWLFVSEELGVSKPDPAFFSAVFRQMDISDPRRVLVVGDNLSTDIQGGQGAGADTAWYNPGGLSAGAVHPTWVIDSLQALKPLVLG